MTSISLPKISPQLDQDVQLLRKGRLDSPEEEIARIEADFEFDEKECRLAPLPPAESSLSLTQAIYMPRLRERISSIPYCEMLRAQSLAIAKRFEKTHHVFFHGQSTKWTVFSYLLKELFKIHRPQEDVRRFKFLRVPKPPLQAELQHYKTSAFVNDRDRSTAEDLISASAGFSQQITGYESADYFLISNESMSMREEMIQQACEEAVSHFYPSLSPISVTQAVERIQSIFDRAAEELDRSGNLYVICIPRGAPEEEIFYRAQPNGSPCPAETASSCSTCKRFGIQVRIYAPLLDPSKHSIYQLSAVSKTKRKQLKQETRRAISQIGKSRFEILYQTTASKKVIIVIAICALAALAFWQASAYLK